MLKRLTIAAAVLAISALPARADWQPAGPIKMLIAFKAGGGADTQARMIAEEIEKRRGWKIIPEQKTGKGGAVLARAMVGMPNDGTVIGMLVTETLGYNMIAAGKAGYSADDFTYLTTTAGFQMGVVARTERGWKSFADVVSAVKGGETIRFGAMSPKLADLAYLLGKAHGVDFNIVSVRGGKGVMDGLNAGDLDIGWGAGIQTKAVLAGDMVNLASGLSGRLKVSPDAPTLRELGVDFDADGYFLFVAPAGLPDDARAALTAAIVEVISDPETKAHGFLNKGFGGVAVLQGAALDDFMAGQSRSSRALLKAVSQ